MLKILALAGFAVLFAVANQSDATLIPVPNASFEDPTLSDGAQIHPRLVGV